MKTLAQLRAALAGTGYRIASGRCPDNYKLQSLENAVDNSGRHQPRMVWVTCAAYRTLVQMRSDSAFREVLEGVAS
jgi:hypothetical protein